MRARRKFNFGTPEQIAHEAALVVTRAAFVNTRGVMPTVEKNVPERIRHSKSNLAVPFDVQKCEMYPQKTVYILGGGPSLKGFDFTRLRDKFVIGCNDAYQLGMDVVDVLFFGDKGWWDKHKDRVNAQYFNPVYSRHTFANKRYLKTSEEDLSDDPTSVVWHRNSGCASLNLALLYGATKIVLLGFDMQLGGDGNSNWHVNEVSKVAGHIYKAYLNGFAKMLPYIILKFGDVEIVNANPNSKLELFPKMELEQALETY